MIYASILSMLMTGLRIASGVQHLTRIEDQRYLAFLMAAGKRWSMDSLGPLKKQQGIRGR